jgi:two-component system, OmpR family, response regulator
LGQFRWMTALPIPPHYDLRRCGWLLAQADAPIPVASAEAVLADAEALEGANRESLLTDPPRMPLKRILLLGIGDPEERAKLLNRGYGDVLDTNVRLPEVEARAARIAESAATLPRSREIGCLRLDLIARDGFVAGRPLGLHPREFDLIWRLAETPGVPAGKAELLSEVWRMAHVPDTNSIAVHVFRLRAKLGIAGLGGMVQTAPSGGYLLAPPGAMPLAAA